MLDGATPLMRSFFGGLDAPPAEPRRAAWRWVRGLTR